MVQQDRNIRGGVGCLLVINGTGGEIRLESNAE